jgi:hypothetical protein
MNENMNGYNDNMHQQQIDNFKQVLANLDQLEVV